MLGSSKSSSTSNAYDNRSVANAKDSIAMGGAAGSMGRYQSGAKVFDAPNYWPIAIAAIIAAVAALVAIKKRKK